MASGAQGSPHEFLKNLIEGFSEEDIDLFNKIISIYTKIDKWWINEIEIPIAGEDVPSDYNRENVFGNQAIVLSAINDIVLENKGVEYKELLRKNDKN